jgi:hypothetical protein
MPEPVATFPKDPDTERAVIACCLLRDEAITEVLPLGPADFTTDDHRAAWKLIRDVHAAGQPLDLVTLAAQARLEGWDGEEIARLAAYQDATASSRHAKHYADILRAHSLRRSLIRDSAQILEAASNGTDPTQLAAMARLAADGIRLPTSAAPTMVDMQTVLSAEPAPIPWIVPGWLAEEETCLCAAEWGTGKSWLALDLAVSLALPKPFAGCLRVSGGPWRVLYVDEENGARMAAHRVRQILSGANVTDPSAVPLRYCCRNGWNLDDPAGYLAIESQIRTFSPHVLILDSLVRFFRNRDENSNSDISGFFNDRLRPLTVKYHVAIVALDHMRKPGQKETGDEGHRVRGASDKVGYADELWTLTGDRQTRDRTLRQDKTRWDELQPDISIKWNRSDDGLAVTITGQEAEQGSQEVILRALTLALDAGEVHGTLVSQVEARGISNRSARSMIGKLHGQGTIRKRKEAGNRVRYWLKDHAPSDAA